MRGRLARDRGVRRTAADAEPPSFIATPFSAAMPVRLTSVPGLASRCLSVGISVWPPPSACASSAASAFSASSTVVGRTNSNAYIPASYRAAIAAQTRDGDSGMSMCVYLEPAGVQRVEDRVHHRGRRADGAGLAAALDPERVVGAGRDAGMVDRDRRQVVRARHRVVHERPADELPVLVVDRVLEQRLADPCARPPCRWPATISGLMTTPKSSAAQKPTTSTAPVAGSTSTSQP